MKRSRILSWDLMFRRRIGLYWALKKRNDFNSYLISLDHFFIGSDLFRLFNDRRYWLSLGQIIHKIDMSEPS